uniref:CD59 glycoprotein n=1 Tax=Prolemur simus TaxID=1328070 RepID=A0A8C8YPN2_PROSS
MRGIEFFLGGELLLNWGSKLVFSIIIISCSCYSLQCYSCINPVPECATVTNCTTNFDACLRTIAGPRIYHQCWKFEDCTFDRISALLGEAELQYYCCKTDKCNHESELEDIWQGGKKHPRGQGMETQSLSLDSYQ